VLSLGVALEIFDFAGDAIVFSKVLDDPSADGIVGLFTACFVMSAVVSLTSLAVKAFLYRKQMIARREQFLVPPDELAQKIQAEKVLLDDAKKMKMLTIVNTVLALLEDVPMLIMTCQFTLLDQSKISALTLASMITSGANGAVKLSKLLQLKATLDQEGRSTKALAEMGTRRRRLQRLASDEGLDWVDFTAVATKLTHQFNEPPDDSNSGAKGIEGMEMRPMVVRRWDEQRIVEWLQTSTTAGWEDCTAAVDGAMVELCVDQTDFASLLITLHRGLAKRNVQIVPRISARLPTEAVEHGIVSDGAQALKAVA